MEEKRPSLPEVVTVRKRPRIPGVTLNRLMIEVSYLIDALHLITEIRLKKASNIRDWFYTVWTPDFGPLS